MDSLENVFLFLDYLTDTQRKRHVVGRRSDERLPFLWRAGIHPDDRKRRPR